MILRVSHRKKKNSISQLMLDSQSTLLKRVSMVSIIQSLRKIATWIINPTRTVAIARAKLVIVAMPSTKKTTTLRYSLLLVGGSSRH